MNIHLWRVIHVFRVMSYDFFLKLCHIFFLLGFFATHDGSSRGNLALHDIISALKWIQQNVEQFGGDPANVTICGHGTGAVLTNILMVAPMAKGKYL